MGIRGKWLSPWKLIFLLMVFQLLLRIEARKHHLEVRFDTRPYIALSTFGFYTDGRLDVKLSKLMFENEDIVNGNELFGLTLDKTTIDQMNPYLDSHQNKCILEEPSIMQRSGPILFFLFDLKRLQVRVQCSPEWGNFHIYKDRSEIPMYRGKRDVLYRASDSNLFSERRKRSVIPQPPGDQNPPVPETAMQMDDGSSEEEPPMVVEATSQATVVTNKSNVASVPAPNVASLPKVKPVEPAAPIQTSAEQKKLLSSSEFKDQVEPAEDNNKLNAQSSENVEEPKKTVDKSMELQLQPKLENNVEATTVSSYYTFDNTHNQLCRDFTLPLVKENVHGVNFYSMSFSMLVTSLRDEGLYNLYFHSCPNYRTQIEVSFNVDIEENNNGNYLSAGEMPLPALYFMMSLLFFLSGLFWVFILKKSKNNVYKIHYIMAVLVFLKSLSLMFHSINYHFIEIRGEHVEAWAILYYIAHLLKGAVLFITIVLIGTGWTFIKHILSDKDKKIFMIVIPLQVLANVAEIIIDESEESDIEFRTWRNIFIFVDLLCCGAILFPIVWSIRHLHEASATDGKAAINLRKLKLFRQFYIMIVCYIYFTRIIVYLLKMTVAFQYAWLDEMFHEMATYVFFVLTGYKFRPASSHPYFSLANDDDDDDEVEVLTQSGLTQGLHRTKAQNRTAPPTTTVIEGNEEERENLITKRESSHEYD